MGPFRKSSPIFGQFFSHPAEGWRTAAGTPVLGLPTSFIFKCLIIHILQKSSLLALLTVVLTFWSLLASHVHRRRRD